MNIIREIWQAATTPVGMGALRLPWYTPSHPSVSDADKAAAQAQAQAAVDLAAQRMAASMPKPACLSASAKATAASLCAQKRSAGQEAVAAFGRAIGATDPYAPAIAQAPCEWALIPECAPPPPPKPSIRAPGRSAPMPPGVSPATLITPPPPEPKSDTALIVGGIAIGALVLGGVYLALRKKAA
jgi:hypothetical protein